MQGASHCEHVAHQTHGSGDPTKTFNSGGDEDISVAFEQSVIARRLPGTGDRAIHACELHKISMHSTTSSKSGEAPPQTDRRTGSASLLSEPGCARGSRACAHVVLTDSCTCPRAPTAGGRPMHREKVASGPLSAGCGSCRARAGRRPGRARPSSTRTTL
jgi:hypothetical protein